MKSFNYRKIFYLGAVIALLIFLHFIGILRPIEAVVERALNPMFAGFYGGGAKIRLWYARQKEDRDLKNQNENLKSEINRLTVENVNLKSLEEENKVLRQHLNFFNKTKQRYQLANIVSRGGEGEAGQSLMIDRGSADGLKTGLVLLSSEGMVVGKVLDVKEHLAQACIITSSNCKLAAALENRNKTIGIAQGDLGLTVKMDFIPQTEELKTGDLAVTSGLEENVPRGLVIGQVREVRKENKELWQSATIEPLIDFNSLTLVSVLIP